MGKLLRLLLFSVLPVLPLACSGTTGPLQKFIWAIQALCLSGLIFLYFQFCICSGILFQITVYSLIPFISLYWWLWLSSSSRLSMQCGCLFSGCQKAYLL